MQETNVRERGVALVVEDDALVALVASEMLMDLGYTVHQAGNADEAAELLGDNEVAVLFTDINMPGSMDGLSFARAVALLRPDTQILIASGRQHISADALPHGAKFLSKPYTEAQIRAALITDRGSPVS